jgi:hypothetical protein
MRFWRKKEKHMVTQVPLSVLMRQIVYDAMLTPTEGIAEMMGLPKISDEVADMEQQAHEDRLSDIAVLLPFIDAHADIVARVATSAYVLDDEQEAYPEEALEQLTRLFRMVSLASAVSCVSTLNNIGLIHSNVEETDEF